MKIRQKISIGLIALFLIILFTGCDGRNGARIFTIWSSCRMDKEYT